MIIPIGDVVPRKTVPYINYLIILANVVVYFAYALRPEQEAIKVVNEYALVPGRWNAMTVFTSMFLHADPVHLFGNMLFLWIAGDNVEDRLGHLPYLLFYFVCGAAGGAAHILTAHGRMAAIPTVGASGAISGIMGAYLVFFPTSKIRFALWLIIFVRFFTLPSWGAIGLWVATQLLMARHQLDGVAKGETAAVAVFAHLGGFAFGILAALLLRLIGRAKPPKKRE
jgi:membrane associated rhomboid family serine protease